MKFAASAVAVVLVAAGLMMSPASAATAICSGVTKAEVAKCDESGYADAMGSSHWGMYKGHNCTNYAAYRLIKNGVARPSYNLGNANTWASRAKSHGVTVDAKPSVGAIGAWPGRNHVVFVESVGAGFLITTEDNYPGYYPKGMYRKTKVFPGDSAYPKQFIHFRDQMTSAVPKVAGTLKVGSTLTASTGSWAPTGVSFSYAWLRDGVAVKAATAAKYVLTPADLGRAMSVKVTGSKSGLTSASATSAKTAVIAAGTLGNSAAPTVTGPTKVGSALSIIPGTWSPAGVSLSHQWLRDGVVLPGATQQTYDLTAADLGSRISARVTGVKDGYTNLVKVTTPTAAVSAGSLANTAAPTITGTPQVGTTLTATDGSWVPADVQPGYQWLAGGTPVNGATAKTYVPTTAQLGKPLTVRVTASKDGFTPVSADSAPSAQVAPAPKPVLANTKTPTVIGKALVGTWIDADNGTWSPNGIAFTYQWYRAGKAVKGGTRATYKLTTADLGKIVAFKVTGNKTGFPALTTTSKPTAVVKAPVIGNSKAPSISGKSTVGTWIKVLPGTWSPGDVKLAYQWYRAGKAVKGGTRDVYKLTTADLGKTVTVKVTASKSGYPRLSKTSKPTGTVK